MKCKSVQRGCLCRSRVHACIVEYTMGKMSDCMVYIEVVLYNRGGRVWWNTYTTYAYNSMMRIYITSP